MVRLRRKSTRTAEDEQIRAEMLESIDETRKLRERIANQWNEVLAISTITQPRLEANGFTQALNEMVETRRKR